MTPACVPARASVGDCDRYPLWVENFKIDRV